MDDLLSRRRLVQVGATGTALTLAGCQFQGDGGNANADDTDDPSSLDGETTVAIRPQINQQEFLAIQQEVQQEVQEGNLSQSEAQEEMRTRQEKLVSDYLDELTTDLESETDLAIGETSTRSGLVLVGGDASELIAALEVEAVAAIVPESGFESQ
ncbi:hypothetical protein C479_10070 [Halovivax asiaticus JCM 14624]|uniref:Uncharacterized protein n=1 Tax=Halovivax asiaticus JCM 14624 TaxID=1227490 RepID=M0BG90_9EURY|nr:hypothetical protein [Halovivax asiaticus]ELZ09911.1 hypothetical protein C479_10070 [Halovivax asiaticus JCM 14624]